jgi:antitoxin component HigA of HigAB toxin-antitoxin module
LQYKTIKSLAQYKSYESYLEKLLWIKSRSSTEQEDVNRLISLIQEWDRNNGSVSAVLPPPVPVDRVKILEGLMKEHKVNSNELATILGESQSGMADLLNYRKEFTPEIISKISKRFAVSPDIFGSND